MSNIEQRIIVDDSTQRVFQYANEKQLPDGEWSGLIEVRDVRRSIDGVSYANWVYKLTRSYVDDLTNIQLEFESDHATLIAQFRNFDLAMTWKIQSDRTTGPHLMLDGDHTYGSLN